MVFVQRFFPSFSFLCLNRVNYARRIPAPRSFSIISPLLSLDDSLRSVSSVLINCGRGREGRHMVRAFRSNFPNVFYFSRRFPLETIFFSIVQPQSLSASSVSSPHGMTVNDPGVPRRRRRLAASSLFRRERVVSSMVTSYTVQPSSNWKRNRPILSKSTCSSFQPQAAAPETYQ